MADTATKRVQWQCPTFRQDKSNWPSVHSWMKRQVESGQKQLEMNPGFEQLEESIRLLSGAPSEELLKRQKSGYSKLQTSRLKRDLREMVNSLSEIRFNPAYTAGDKTQEKSAHVLNSYGSYWYSASFADLKIRKALQWMAITPRGWLEICYRYVPGRNERLIDLIPHSYFDVVMTGVPESGDYQEAYTVTIIKDLPVYLAHSLWPDYQSDLVPDKEGPRSWIDKVKDKAVGVVADVFAATPDKVAVEDPRCRLFYQYVIDLSINRSGKTMKMGYEKRTVDGVEIQVETPWSYDVPSVGEPIVKGRDANGEVVYKIATEEDARIFPGRRLLVGNESKLFYDGPDWNWYGGVNLVPFSADSWPFGEFSMVHDLAPMQEAINEIERIVHQLIRRRYKPPMKYNYRAVDRNKAKSFNMDSDQRIGYNGQEGTGENIFSPIMPKDFYQVEAYVQEFVKYLVEALDDQAGRQSAVAMSKLKSMTGGDSLEKLLELVGPIVRGIAREMERSMRDLADMFKYLVYQYITTPEILPIVGEDGITPVNYDYDPGNLIPSHLPGEAVSYPSIFTRQQRAKWACRHIKFTIQPGTLHEVTQMTQKLLFLQLWRGGFKISSYDMAQVLRLGNYGKVDGSTMYERWRNEKRQEMEDMAQMQQELGIEPQQGPSGQGSKGGFKGGGGRAPSGQAAPKLQTKGDGRPVVRESP